MSSSGMSLDEYRQTQTYFKNVEEKEIAARRIPQFIRSNAPIND